jgi:Pyruvate/2-oxoacid:ferredoxin oxidoreductase delta subunit
MVSGLLVIAAAVLLAYRLAGDSGGFLRSTRSFLRESGLGLNALHGYIYGRWTPRYVRILLGLPAPDSLRPAAWAATWFARRYHGKVLTHEHARAIIELDREIPGRDLEQIVPYPLARDIVLNGPPDGVVYECPCRHARETHCEPTQVCMAVGKPISDFVLEHQPDSSRRLTQAEAPELLEAEHRRGHVHCAWFKDAMLSRFYAICNCCRCCCGGIEKMRQGVGIVAGSGYVVQIDAALCANCDDCVTACPFGGLSRRDGETVHDWDLCMGCGVCAETCATGAISLVRDEKKGVPLEVRALPALSRG